MNLTEAKCTMCGASLSVSAFDQIIQCDYCKTSNIVANTIDLAKADPRDSAEISRLRENLAKFIERDSIEEILRVSGSIKNIIPNDFSANYFFSYAKQVYGEDNHLYYFLKDPPAFTPEELQQIIQHISTRGNIHDKPAFTRFIKTHSPQDLSNYNRVHEQRVIKEQEYLNYPRDVFVSFSKYDYSKAKEVVDYLEEQGYSCWISKRNLRPGLPEKGRAQSEDAISSCDIFLWISSEHSLINAEMADELEYAMEEQRQLIVLATDQTPSHKLVQSAIKQGLFLPPSTTNANLLTAIKQLKDQMLQSTATPPNIIEPQVSAPAWTEVDLKHATQEFLSLFQYVVLNQRTNNDVVEFLYYMTGIRKVTDLPPRKRKVFADLYQSLSEVYKQNYDHSEYMLKRFVRYTNKRHTTQSNKLTVAQLKQLIDSMSRRFK
jgi:hypothetical protein